jgi:hypothetical protein
MANGEQAARISEKIGTCSKICLHAGLLTTGADITQPTADYAWRAEFKIQPR